MAWRPTVAKSSGWSVAGEAEDGSPDDCGAPGPQVPVAALADRPARSSTPRAGRRQSGARSESRCRRSSPTRAQRAGVGGVSGGRAGATAAWQHPRTTRMTPRDQPAAAPGARPREREHPSASRPAYASRPDYAVARARPRRGPRTRTMRLGRGASAEARSVGRGLLLLAMRLDHLVADVRGHLLVVVERRGEGAPAAGDRAQLRRVAEELGLGNLGRDLLHPVRRDVHAKHPATTAVEVPVDVAHEALRNPDLNDHDRFLEHGLAVHDALLERHRRGD